MFRSRSKFDNEAPMSRRGMRVGLVVTVVLAMVAVLASTVGVISSQTSTPSLTLDSTTGYSGLEGDAITVVLTSSSSTDYTLTLNTVAPTSAGFDLAQDITPLEISLDGGNSTEIPAFPHSVVIGSSVNMITLKFTVANDELIEPGEKFTLSATPGTGTAVTTEITLVDPIWEVNLGAAMDINEGATSSIPITLSRPVTQYLKDQAARASETNGGYSRTVAKGSNFEDISPLGLGVGTAFPFDDNNEQYDRNLGFEFEFYGKKHSDIAVHTNGFIGFTDNAKGNVLENVDTSLDKNKGDNTPGTGSFKLPIVAPLLSPLAYHISDSHGMGITPRPIFYEARLETGTINDRYIVQYTNARAGVPGIPDRVEVTFQVALFANGRIEFRYENIPSTAQGVSKIGISNGSGTGKFDEFSYRTNNFSGGAESDIRIVYTPPLKVEAVTIDSDGNQVGSSVDIIETISVGDSSGMVETTHDRDGNWDENQDYTVRLTHNSAAVITGAAVRYTVMDDDKPEVVLEQVSGSSVEGNSVVLRARLTNAPSGAPEELTVNLARGAASTADAGDYDTIPAMVTIPAGEQVSNSFTVMITDDTEVELNENLIIEVTSLVYGGRMEAPTTPGVVDITITSNDQITVTITASDAAEGGVTTVNISLGQAFPANTPNGALMLVLDGTDRSNDVSGLPADVTDDLRNGTSASVQVTLTDDSILEGTEVVTVKLVTAAASLAGILAPVSASFNINDNESGMVSVAQVSSTSDYAEGATVQFEFALQSGVTTEVPITVNYELTAATVDEEGNRRAPADATDRSIVLAGGLAPGFAKGLALPVRGLAQAARSMGVVTIPKNGNRVLLTIQLTDDTTAEETELLRVGLMGVSAGSGARVDVNDNMDETVIRILDNEEPVFEIIGSSSVNEDDGRYPVTLRRLGRLTHNGMAVNEIQFEIVGEGADGGDFRGPLIRKFTFSPGSALSDLIRLPLADDNSEESDKTFQILVYAPGQMPGQVTPQAAPIVDSSGARFTSITLIDSDVADFFGALPATGGPVLPVWLLLVLALTGVVLLVPTLRRI